MKANECLCSSCRQVKTENNFYAGIGIYTGKRLPICKDCCKQKLNTYNAVIGSDGAMWSLLAEMGTPFIKSVWEETKVSTRNAKAERSKDQLYVYLKKLGDTNVIYQGFWDSDTMLNELTGVVKERTRDDVEDLEVMREKWGKYDDSNEAYIFLEKTFNEYTEDIYEMDANLINRYKDLCVAEYVKRKAQESGDPSEISKAQDTVIKQLKLLKLDDFKQSVKSEEEKRIERLGWIIENTRPAECEDLEKYKDFSGFGKVWDDIKRCVINLVGGTKEYPDIPKDVI